MATVSGICRHPETGVVGAYQVFAHDYYTGALLGSAISDATTGAYSITVPDGARVRVVRVNASLVVAGSALVLGLPMDGVGGTFEELAGGHSLSAYSVEQAVVAGSPAGSATIFDSNADYLSLGADPRLAFPGEFEFGFNVLHDSMTTGDYFFWSSGGNPGGISFTAAGALEWYGIDGQSGQFGTYTAGQWFSVTLSRDASGVIRAFKGGVIGHQVASNEGTFGNASGSALLTIGRWPGASSTAFRGKMSGFYMANRALHVAPFTPVAGIPDASIYVAGTPFAASEQIDYVNAGTGA